METIQPTSIEVRDMPSKQLAYIRHVGPYVQLRFPDGVTIDRVSTGVRIALWYSCIGALEHARVVQFDKDALRIVADTTT